MGLVLGWMWEGGWYKRTDHLEVDVSRDLCVNRKSGGEIPAAEVEGRADDEVGDLGHDLGADESDPVVCFRLLGNQH